METVKRRGGTSCPDCGTKLVHVTKFALGLKSNSVRVTGWVHERNGSTMCPPRLGVPT